MEHAAATGYPVAEIERVDAEGVLTPISGEFTSGLDTLLVISVDSRRTRQGADAAELDALRRCLATPGNLLFVAPHHDVGDAPEAEFRHHDDRTLPPKQRFGGFACSILAGLGVPVENRFGCARRSMSRARRHRSSPSGTWTGSGSLKASRRSTGTPTCRTWNAPKAR